MLPYQTDLRKWYLYDPDTGHLLHSRGAMIGKRAGGSQSAGYRMISFFGKRYLEHRVIWMYVHGEAPEGQIDHINGDRSDNRIENLRLASAKQNRGNMKKPRNNSSGFKGVTYHKKNKCWIAQIGGNKEHVYLGSFGTPEEAHAAYLEAAERRYGEFANPG